jgi:hypothetical protein
MVNIGTKITKIAKTERTGEIILWFPFLIKTNIPNKMNSAAKICMVTMMYHSA